MDEETGKWVILNFFGREPIDVYGLFDTEEEARNYAETQGMAINGNAYSVQMVLNAHYQVNEMAELYQAALSRGRP